MLLIPLGPVNREVRRWPWVTIGIVALEVLRKARPSLTSRFGYIVAALMERRGQTPDAVSTYEEVAARFPSDPAARRAAGHLGVLGERALEPGGRARGGSALLTFQARGFSSGSSSPPRPRGPGSA